MVWGHHYTTHIPSWSPLVLVYAGRHPGVVERGQWQTWRTHHLLECAPPTCNTILTTPPPILPRFPLQLEMNSTMCSLCKLLQNEGIIMTKTNLTIRNHQLKWFVKALSQLNHTPDHSVNHHLQYMDILQVIQTWRPGNEATQYPKHKQWNDKAS